MDINEIIDIIGAYEEDKKYIILIKDAVIEELKSIIPGLEENNLTSRQELLIITYIQHFYDNRELYEEKKGILRSSISTMLIKEGLRNANKV